MVIPTLDRHFAGGSVRSYGKSNRCEAENCDQATREGKQYCPDHVERHDYVSALLSQLEEKEKEEQKVKKHGAKAVTADSLTVKEIMVQLTQLGQRTLPRLCRDMNMDIETVRPYIAYMKKENMILVGRTTRGSETVRVA